MLIHQAIHKLERAGRQNHFYIKKITEQVNLFNYLGNMTAYEGELDIDNELNSFLKIKGFFE